MGGTGLRFLEHPWMSKRSAVAGPATTCPGLADLTTLCLAGRPVSSVQAGCPKGPEYGRSADYENPHHGVGKSKIGVAAEI